MIEIRCYNKVEKWTSRNKAIEFYTEGAMCSEGHEKMRYMNILMDLYAGKDYCDDRNGD